MWLVLLVYILGSYGVLGDDENCEPRKNNEKVLLDAIFNEPTQGHLLLSPVNNYSSVIPIYFKFYSIRVTYDQVSGDSDFITLDMKYYVYWEVPCLKWDPAKYSNILKLNNIGSQIWIPAFELELEYLDITGAFGYAVEEASCSLAYDGSVLCRHWSHFTIPCVWRDQKLWPFDVNTCALKLLANPTSEQAYRLIIFQDMFRFNSSTGDWKIKELDAEVQPNSDALKYYFKSKNNNKGLTINVTLQRRSSFITACIVFPTLVSTTLTITSLALRIDVFPKIYLAAISLGCHIYITTTAITEIPKNIPNPPLLVLFLRDSIILTSLVLMTSLLTHYMIKRVSSPPHYLLLLKNLICSTRVRELVFYRVHSDPKKTVENGQPLTELQDSNNNAWAQIACLLNCLLIVGVGLTYFVYICILIHFFISVHN